MASSKVNLRTITRQNKIAIRNAAIFLITVTIGIVVYFVVTISDKPITNYEIRLGAVLALLAMFFVALMLLLMQRALVMHTAFVIRLRDQLVKHGNSMDQLEKEYKNKAGVERDLTKAVNKLADGIDNTFLVQ